MSVTENQKEKVVRFLRSLSMARNLPALWLLVTSIFVIHPMAATWAAENFPTNSIAQNISKILIISIVVGALDGVLDLCLRFTDSAPTLKGKGKFSLIHLVLIIGFMALCGTGTLSFWAAPLMADFLQKDNHASSDSTKVLVRQKLDLENAAAAAQIAGINATEAEYNRKVQAIKQDSILNESKIVNNKKYSSSWRNDYYKARNDDNHWFWKCSECPAKYQEYRDAILQSRQKYSSQIVSLLRDQSSDKKRMERASSIDDKTVDLLTELVRQDSVRQNRNVIIFDNTRKALIASEIIAVFAIIAITMIIWKGRQEYKIDSLGIDFISLFSFIEAIFSKIISLIYYTILGIAEGFSSKEMGDLIKNLLLMSGDWLTGRYKRKIEELNEARKIKTVLDQDLKNQQELTLEAKANYELANRQLSLKNEELEHLSKEAETYKTISDRQELIIAEKLKRDDYKNTSNGRTRQSKSAKAQSDSRKTPNVGDDKKKDKTGKEFEILFSDNNIVVIDKNNISKYDQTQLWKFCDLVGKWYKRQFESKTDRARKANAIKYKHAKAFCRTIGIDVIKGTIDTKNLRWPNVQ